MSGKKLAIDLGTTNTLVFVEGKGIVVNEPTVVAYGKKDKKIVATGERAGMMIGKSPQDIVVQRPLQNGVIARYNLTEVFLKHIIHKALGRMVLIRPEIMISVPAGLTSVEERAVIEAVNSAGASRIYLIPEPIAAAIGVKIPVGGSNGNMIVNIGGGTAEVAVISLNGLVGFQSERKAGNAIDQALTNYIRKKYKLIIGEQMAELVKFEIGSAIEVQEPLKMEVRGNDARSGLPANITLNTNDLVEPIREVLVGIIDAVKTVLETTPPELTSDIIDQGIVLSGGTSLIRNIDKLFTEALDVAVHVAENPLTAVVEGVAEAMQNVDLLSRVLKNK